MIVSIVLSSIFVLIIYKKIMNQRYHHLISLIPSPPRSRLPFVGNLNMMAKELNQLPKGSKPGEAFFILGCKLAEQFNNQGIVAVDFELMAGTWIYIFKPIMCRDLLKDLDNISKHELYFLATDFLGSNNLLLSDGRVWKSDRKLLTPAFHYTVLDQFIPSFNDCAMEFCTEVNSVKKVNDLYQIVSHYLMKSFMETSLGIKVDKSNRYIVDEYLKYFELYSDCYSKRITNVFYAYDFIFNITSDGRKRTESLKYLHKFTSDAIKNRMEYLISEGKNLAENRKKSCLADTLIKEHMKNPALYSMENIRNQLDAFTFAGHETTSITLTNTLYLIAIHPYVMKRIQEGIDTNLSDGDIAAISVESLNKLKYLDAVLKESQRYYPAVSAIGRKITKEISVGGYTLPVGSNVKFNIFKLHRDIEQFTDPNTFNPDRFLPDSQENMKRHPFAFLPFSAGLRNCIGQKFAIYELKIFLIHILSKFDINTNVNDIRFCQGLTLSMSNKIDIEFKMRK